MINGNIKQKSATTHDNSIRADVTVQSLSHKTIMQYTVLNYYVVEC